MQEYFDVNLKRPERGERVTIMLKNEEKEALYYGAGVFEDIKTQEKYYTISQWKKK